MLIVDMCKVPYEQSAKTHVAQVNLFLRITGKRPDGYHDLSSLFHVCCPSITTTFFLQLPFSLSISNQHAQFLNASPSDKKASLCFGCMHLWETLDKH
jgi:hypothetical protein